MMPIHHWTRVDANIFHAFHSWWIGDIGRALNAGLLPPDFYALPEQDAGAAGPDVLALRAPVGPPRARFTATFPASFQRRPKILTIRHNSGDQIVAMIEIVSPGNKAASYRFQTFLTKLATALREGINLLVIDLFPPTPRDPRGLHSAFWEHLGSEPFAAPAEKPLTLAAYAAWGYPAAFIETTAVGRELPDMPLILMPDQSVQVPLERTYRQAYDGMPARSKAPLEQRRGC